MDKNKDYIFKICIVISLAWIGYCAFQISKNGRYQATSKVLVTIDTHTGNLHKAKFVE